MEEVYKGPTMPIGAVIYARFGDPENHLVIFDGNQNALLRINGKGEVFAPSLEAAGEAGRVFAEKFREHVELILKKKEVEDVE